MKNIPNKIYLLTDKEKRETLSECFYFIPDGYKATVSGGVIQISIKRDNRIKYGDWRCKDCKFYTDGKVSINSLWTTMVCKLRPKILRNPKFAKQKLFYAANRNDKACERFEKKGGQR